MRIAKNLLLVSLMIGTAAASPILITSLAALNADDSVNWFQLGPDQTVLDPTFPATSAKSLALDGSFGNGAGSVISVVCSASPSCSWIPSGSGLNAGDSLIVTSNGSGGATGPLDLSLGSSVYGGGLEIQVDIPGTYTAYIQAFDGGLSLGLPQFEVSDVSGDPLFIGLLDSTADITKIEVGLAACGGFGCSPDDFAVDTLSLNEPIGTPEPSAAWLLFAGAAALLAARIRNALVEAVLALLLAHVLAPAVSAQIQVNNPLPVISDNQAVKTLGASKAIAAAQPIAAVNPLPIGLFSVVGYDGSAYQGEIVGRSPWARGLRTTTVQVVLIPLIVKTPGAGGPYILDPTAADAGCLGAGNTAVSLTQNGPILNAPPTPWVMNGVAVGGETFNDAHLRAEFWNLVGPGGNAYHLALPYITAAPQTLDASGQTTSNANTLNYPGLCGVNAGTTNTYNKLGYLNINYLDPLLQGYITSLGIQPNQFPLFIIYRTVIADGPANTVNNCCILGYHNNNNNASSIQDPGQTYGIALFDTGDVFGGVADTSVMAHEVGEWANDPGGVNPTPLYSAGQTASCAGGGQNDLEVGDPLSGISNNHVVTMGNGFTYHLQELAYFSWFFSADRAGSLGAGVCAGLGSGCHSTNGTFQGPARACPTGGSWPN